MGCVTAKSPYRVVFEERGELNKFIQQEGSYMFHHSLKAAPFFSVLIAALIYSLSLAGVASAQSNTSLGIGALQNNTTGANNTAVGGNALFTNNTGSNNTATGLNSALSNTIGTFNTANGAFSMLFNTTGDFNTASGVQTLLGNSTGIGNVTTGVFALISNTTGDTNTGIGTDRCTPFEHRGRQQHRSRIPCAP
jgi:hypothetical protein